MYTYSAEHNGSTYSIPERIVQEAMLLKKESLSTRPLIDICMDIAPEKVTRLPQPDAPPKSLRDALLDFAFHEGISPQDLRTLESILKEYGHA